MTEYRLFIAIELPKSATESLTSLQAQLVSAQPVRWVKPEQIHLTLQFLGNVPVGNIDRLVEALGKNIPVTLPFNLTIDGVGVFPNLKRPRIVWAGVGGETGRLSQLHAATIAATRAVGFAPEDRPFKAHLTLGRTEQQARSRDYQQIGQIIARHQPQVGQIAAFPVEHVSLMRSQLQAGGPLYTALAKIKPDSSSPQP